MRVGDWNGENLEDLHRPEPEPFPKKWQDCPEFVGCLRAREYVTVERDGSVTAYSTPGPLLYMYELWQDGKRGGQT